MERLVAVLDEPGVKHREAISAVKAILSARKINLENISVSMEARKFMELEAEMDEIERVNEVRGLKLPAR
jgi:hypothetical protein